MTLYMDICKTLLIYFLYLTKNKKEIPGDVEILESEKDISMNVEILESIKDIPMNVEKTIVIDNNLQPNVTQDMPEPRPARRLLYDYARKAEKNRRMKKDRKHIKSKIPFLGSRKKVLSNGNYGFFSAVVESYNTHSILDMRPDDWFFTFVQKLALAIDKQAKTDEVRKFFVNHEGKKKLTVNFSTGTPMDVDYNYFFDEMIKKIQDNINTPNYVEMMTADFSTSTKNDRIITSINTMNSMQEFFEYHMRLGCGIPAVTMRGTEGDWNHLILKLENLEKLLLPIKEQLDKSLPPNWWKKVKNISQKLLETYQGNPDLEWWHNIIVKEKAEKYVRWGSGGSRLMPYEATNGWFLTDILGLYGAEDLSEIENPLVTVPLTIDSPGSSEEGAFIAGIVGYLVEDEDTWPRVSAVHSWALCLEPTSKYFELMKLWEGLDD